MFARIELDDASDFDASLAKFQSCFPKFEQVFFPTAKAKGASWYGFSFNMSDPLLDWSAISTWCATTRGTGDGYDDNCAYLNAGASAASMLGSAIAIFTQQIRKQRAFRYELTFWLQKRKSRFSIELEQVNKRLEVSLRFNGLKASDKATNAAMHEAWRVAQTKLPVLRKVSLEAGKKFSCEVLEDDGKLQWRNDQLKFSLDSPATIRSGLTRVCELATEVEQYFEGIGTSLSLELLPIDVPKVSEPLREVFGDYQYVHYEGAYHEGFHPDQVLKKFPREGYWSFPLFTVRLGRDEFNLVYAYLVQTPKERFFELLFDDEADLKKLSAWFKGKSELKVYDGPDQERWNLHKLRKKK